MRRRTREELRTLGVAEGRDIELGISEGIFFFFRCVLASLCEVVSVGPSDGRMVTRFFKRRK